MATFCPNLSDPDIAHEFSLLTNSVGEDVAYWYWDRFKGDFSAIQSTLSQTGVRLQPTPKRPNIEPKQLPTGKSTSVKKNTLVKKVLLSDKIDDTNNQAIWDLENELGLVSIRSIEGKKYKFYNSMSIDQAHKLRDWITSNYLDVKVGFVTAWDGEGTGIRIFGRPENVDKKIAENKAAMENRAAIDRGIINEETREDLLPDPAEIKDSDNTIDHEKELEHIRALFSKIGWEIHDAKDILNLIDKNVNFDMRSKALLDLMKQHVEKYPGLKFEFIHEEDAIEGMEDAYAYMDPKTGKIQIIYEAATDPATANYGYLSEVILHEYVHAFTLRVLNDPSTPEEKDFVREITKLWRTAKINAEDPSKYGYSNVKEFVATIMTSSDFANEIESMPYNIWNRIIKFISDLFGLNLVAGEDTVISEVAFDRIMKIIPSQDTFSFDGQAAGAETQAEEFFFKDNLDISKRDDFVKKIRGIEDRYDKVKGKGVIHKHSGWTMLPTTAVINQFHQGVEPEELEVNPKIEEAKERGGNIGNVVHAAIESILTGKALRIKKDNPFSSSPELMNDLRGILKKFEGKDVTIMSEVFIADQYKGIGGVIDLVIIDKKGNVHLYDFKTKEHGFKNWTKRFPNTYDGTLNFSSSQVAHAQLTMYKQIWEKVTGTPVVSTTAVLIEPSVKDNKITGAKLSSVENGYDNFNNHSSPLGRRIMEAIRNIDARKDSHDEFLSKLPSIKIPNRTFAAEKQLEEFTYSALEFSQMENTLNKLIKELDKKIDYIKRHGSRTDIEKLEYKREQALTQKDSADSLKLLLELAMEETGNIQQEYANARKNKTDITIGRLFHWKNVVEAYEGFNDYGQYLTRQIPLMDDPKVAKEILRQINVVTSRINNVKSWYEEDGMSKLVKFLSPFYNRIRAERKGELAKIWRTNPNLREGLSEAEFIKKGLLASKQSDDAMTTSLLTSELRKASTDIGALGLWLDNLLDSKDPVTVAMVKAFASTEHLSHVQALDMRADVINSLKRFESKISDRVGTVSYRDLYGFMLERNDKGEYTGYFVKDKFNSTMMEEFNDKGELIGGYRFILNETRGLPEEERDKIRREWKNERTTLDSVALNSAKWEFIMSNPETAKYKDELSNFDAEVARAFKKGEKPESLKDLANREEISHEAADAIEDWIWKNAWSYRELKPQWKSKYESKQWKELMRHKENNTPEWELYEQMMKMLDDADRMLPYSSRLGGKLPGVEKRTTEMLKDGTGLLGTIKNSMKQTFSIRADDTERDNFNHEGEERTFLPIHYTGKVDPEMQSYDIPTIVYKYWQSANDFSNKIEILPEMELAKHFINNRQTDPINAKRFKLGRRLQNKGEMKNNNNNLAKQVNEWFSAVVYGQPKKHEGKILGMDVSKLADLINKYTSLNLLGLNVIQGAANMTLGEVLQLTEGIAKEYMTLKSYRKGTQFYMRNFFGVMGDVGKRGANNVVSHLMEEFDILDEWEGSDFSRRQKYRQAMTTNTLFFTTHAGEHEMQGRFLLGMLSDKEAFDKDGNSLGSMLNMYSVDKDTGKLVLSPKVDEKNSEWTESDRFEFMYKVRGILSRLHGEYSDIGKVALQRNAIGRMAFMFRKFIVPGFRRRWASKAYMERLGDYVEGNYVTTGKFAYAMMADLVHFKFDVGTQWKGLSDHEKANVRRTISEVSFLIMAIILANLAVKNLKDDDDDERMWAFMAYQALRLKAELLFFIKPDETMSILRSPMASMSVIENMIKLSGQMFHPGELYERGPWKGKPKIAKTLTNMAPGYRQFYRVRDLKDQLSWFSSKVN